MTQAMKMKIRLRFVLKHGCLWGLLTAGLILLCSFLGWYLLPHP